LIDICLSHPGSNRTKQSTRAFGSTDLHNQSVLIYIISTDIFTYVDQFILLAEFPIKMAAVEELIEQCFIRKLVEDEKKTHKEIATVLRQAFPRITGISERSVRRYCATYNIHRRDSSLSTEVLDSLITSAVAKVISHHTFSVSLVYPCMLLILIIIIIILH